MQKNRPCSIAAVVILICLQGQLVVGQESLLTGGLSNDNPADTATQAIANQVGDTVQNLLGRVFTQFALQSYKTQVVAGTNYYMKVLIADTRGAHYVAHLKVFKAIRGSATLTGLFFPQMWNDPISYDGYFLIGDK